MISVLLLCALWCGCLFLAWRAFSRKRRVMHPLPPPLRGGIPIIGHTHMLSGDTEALWNLINYMSEECNKNGGIVYCKFGTQLYYLITDPDDALTASNACMNKHFIYDYMKQWLGNGLFTSSEALWQRHRKLLNPAFGAPVVHDFLGIFNTMAKQLVTDVEPMAGRGKFDMAHYLRVIAFETFSKTSFGINEENLKEFALEYMVYADQVMNMIAHRFQNIWLRSEFIYKLTGLKKKMDGLVNKLNDMANQVIASTKEEMKKPNKWTATGTRSKPLVNLLMELKNEDALTEKEIKEEADTAIIAGFDTTSSTLTCMLILLGTYPEVQQKVYEEMMEVLGPDRDLEKDDLKKLVYTEAVIKESLRILPIGPATLRKVERDVKLKNYTMRAGSACVVLACGLHRNAIWGEDVHVFRPERWFEPKIAAHGNHYFVGFSLGKRSCIGKTYATVSMKATLAHFIRRYRIRANVHEVKFKLDVVLKPTTTDIISIEKRN